MTSLNYIPERGISSDARSKAEQSSGQLKSGKQAVSVKQAGNANAAVTSLLVALKESTRSRDVKRGKRVHGQATQSGELRNKYVANSLINMYAKCARIDNARFVFDNMHSPNVVSWNTLLQGYVENGECEIALELFRDMRVACEEAPDGRTFVAALTACAGLAARKDGNDVQMWLEVGKRIHSQVAANRCCDVFVGSSLVDFYARCESMIEARRVFDGMKERDIVCWNALLQGYADNGEFEVVIDLFEGMERDDGCCPNARTYLAALSACRGLIERETRSGKTIDCCSGGWFVKGKAIYSSALLKKCCDTFVQNVVVEMFVKSDNMELARGVFDRMARRDVVVWNVLLLGYVDNGQSLTALQLFEAMEEGGRGGCSPDARTFVAALGACCALAETEGRNASQWLEKGTEIFSRARSSRGCCDVFVETAMLNLYAKCGRMSEAQSFFEEMKQQNSVSWTSLVRGYVDNGDSSSALRTVTAMDLNGVSLISATLVAALRACGNAQIVQRGEIFHMESLIRGLDQDLLVTTALVEFYGKCGKMRAARSVFDSIVAKDIWAWNSLICGYSLQGDSSSVFGVFEEMRRKGFAPNEVTFTQLLSVCSHAGLTEKGKEVFDEMQEGFGVAPDVMHYNCLVDLLARANKLDEAMEVVRGMCGAANEVTWTAILGGCRKWKNVAVGKVAYEALLKLNEGDAGAYVLMSNIIYGGEQEEKSNKI